MSLSPPQQKKKKWRLRGGSGSYCELSHLAAFFLLRELGAVIFFLKKDFMVAFFFLPETVSFSVALAGLLPHWPDNECAGACAALVGFVCLLLYFLKLQM